MKILVVEDNPMNLELMTDLLEFEGLQVVTAKTGEEGVAQAAEHLPDLILMDVSLPGMDGLEATRAIRAQAATAHIPVVAVTAHAGEADRDHVAAAGCAGYLTKPIDVATFVGDVTKYAGAS